MMTVDGVPNVRVCSEPVREGADVRGQNVIGSVDRDLMSVIDRVASPFLPVGFYYRTMIRPRRLWPLYEKFLRNAAGLGRVGGAGVGHSRRYDGEHRNVGVLVIGGGRSGQAAAAEAAAAATTSCSWTSAEASRGRLRADAPARAIGIYEDGLVPVDAGTVLYRVRAEQIVVATGTVEQPLVFPGNDLVGVMLPGAVRRLVDDWALRPGARAVVVAADEGALEITAQLERAGVEVARVVDLAANSRARSPRGAAKGSSRRSRSTVRSSTATCLSSRVAASRPIRFSPKPARGSNTIRSAGSSFRRTSRPVFEPLDPSQARSARAAFRRRAIRPEPATGASSASVRT